MRKESQSVLLSFKEEEEDAAAAAAASSPEGAMVMAWMTNVGHRGNFTTARLYLPLRLRTSNVVNRCHFVYRSELHVGSGTIMIGYSLPTLIKKKCFF